MERWSNLSLKNLQVLYFPYELVITAFKSVGIDAFYDEDTADRDFAKKERRWDALPGKDKTKVAIKLLMLNKEAIELFMTRLTEAVVEKFNRFAFYIYMEPGPNGNPQKKQSNLLNNIKKKVSYRAIRKI